MIEFSPAHERRRRWSTPPGSTQAGGRRRAGAIAVRSPARWGSPRGEKSASSRSRSTCRKRTGRGCGCWAVHRGGGRLGCPGWAGGAARPTASSRRRPAPRVAWQAAIAGPACATFGGLAADGPPTALARRRGRAAQPAQFALELAAAGPAASPSPNGRIEAAVTSVSTSAAPRGRALPPRTRIALAGQRRQLAGRRPGRRTRCGPGCQPRGRRSRGRRDGGARPRRGLPEAHRRGRAPRHPLAPVMVLPSCSTTACWRVVVAAFAR